MLTWFSYNNGENFYQYWGTKRSASMLYGIFMDAVPIGQYKYPFGFCEDNRYTGETFAKKTSDEKSVYWYNSNNANAQCNIAGRRYAMKHPAETVVVTEDDK